MCSASLRCGPVARQGRHPQRSGVSGADWPYGAVMDRDAVMLAMGAALGLLLRHVRRQGVPLASAGALRRSDPYATLAPMADTHRFWPDPNWPAWEPRPLPPLDLPPALRESIAAVVVDMRAREREQAKRERRARLRRIGVWSAGGLAVAASIATILGTLRLFGVV